MIDQHFVRAEHKHNTFQNDRSIKNSTGIDVIGSQQTKGDEARRTKNEPTLWGQQ